MSGEGRKVVLCFVLGAVPVWACGAETSDEAFGTTGDELEVVCPIGTTLDNRSFSCEWDRVSFDASGPEGALVRHRMPFVAAAGWGGSSPASSSTSSSSIGGTGGAGGGGGGSGCGGDQVRYDVMCGFHCNARFELRLQPPSCSDGQPPGTAPTNGDTGEPIAAPTCQQRRDMDGDWQLPIDFICVTEGEEDDVDLSEYEQQCTQMVNTDGGEADVFCDALSDTGGRPVTQEVRYTCCVDATDGGAGDGGDGGGAS